MSSIAANGADVTIVSDGTDSDSDQELFNMAAITDKTSLLSQEQRHSSPSPAKQGHSPPGKRVVYQDDLPRNGGFGRRKCSSGGMRPESMEEELHGESSTLLPLTSDLKLSEARSEKRRDVIRRFSLACLVTLLLWLALPLHSPSLAVLNIAHTSSRVITLACLYSCVVVSSLAGPYVVRNSGVRWTVIAGCAGVSMYTITRFDASLYLVVPGVITAGLCLGPCLCALWTYIISLASEFSVYDDSKPAKSLLVFSGVFHTWIGGALFCAQLLTMVILPFPWTASRKHHTRDVSSQSSDENLHMPQRELNHTSYVANYTSPLTNSSHTLDITSYAMTLPPVTSVTSDSGSCGPAYCWHDFIHTFKSTIPDYDVSDEFRMQALLGCLLVCSLGALLLAWLSIEKSPSSISSEEENKGSKTKVFNTTQMMAVISLLKQSEMVLLIPPTVFIGLQQFLGYSVYIQAFVACDLDSRMASFAVLCVAGTPLLLSSPLGFLASYTGRVRLLLPLAVLHTCLLILLLAWPALPTHTPALHFVLGALWGLAGTGWQLVCTALLGSVFPCDLEAATAHYHLWQGVGYLLVYTFQAVGLCSRFLLLLALLLLITGAFCYVAVEIRMRLHEQEARSSPEDHSLVMPTLDSASWLPNINPMQVRKERTSALLNRMPSVVDPELIST